MWTNLEQSGQEWWNDSNIGTQTLTIQLTLHPVETSEHEEKFKESGN